MTLSSFRQAATLRTGEPAPGEARGDVEVVAELGRGTDSVVYHVRRAGEDYALKVLDRPGARGAEDTARFHREAALLARVDHPGVPRVYDVGLTDGRPSLVLELLDGQPLADAQGGHRPDESAIVRLAADVAAALAAAHRAGLVHRDIKPANIMIAADGRARLIDFGLAATGQEAGRPAVGTFTYSPPEQTGMLNRPVDGRSDLYSLGVVLFEYATGDLPFRARDVGELLAMHASAAAPDVRTQRPDLSAGLAAVVARLLTKDPDDRFPTAGDLLQALAGLPGAPAGVSVAAEPAPSLPGRDDELAALTARWARARQGAGGVALIGGAPGAGKSHLAEAVAATARADGALVLSGKCDEDSALPMAALRNAVEGWLRGVTTLPEPERAAAVDRLRAAAGAGAALLRPLSPTLSMLLDAPELAADGQHDQFAGAVASFLTALAGDPAGAGLLVVLNDVQWLDEAGRAVLRRLAEDVADVPLLVVATARDDRDGEAGCAAVAEAAGPALDLRLSLAPLPEAGVERLVHSYLAGSSVGPEVVAELSARGHGNPFTILEYLRTLIDVGALRPSWGTWRLDTDLLARLNLPTDVLDLIVARVDGLGELTREVLTVAAAIGHVVDVALLAAVTGTDPSGPLAEAVERGLTHPRQDAYAFVHDRIREALLSAVGPDGRRALHQRIAEELDRRPAAGPADVYATARHYANGATGRTPERVFATGLAAGRLALDENAPDAALSFLEAAEAAAGGAGITPDSRFREALGVAYWSTGRLDPALEQLETGLAGTTDPVRRAALLLQLSHVLRTRWDLTRAMACARQGLAELGAGVPANRVLFGLATAGTIVRWLAGGTRPPAAEPVTGADAERLALQVLLCRAVVAAAAIDLKHGRVVAFTVRSETFAHRLGATSGYLTHMSGMGTVAGSMGLRRRRDGIYRQAREIATTLGDAKGYANAAWTEGFSKVLGKEILVGEWADVVESHRRYLEVDFYTNILLMRCRDLVQRGYAERALAWHDRGRSRISPATADSFPGFAVLAGMAGALLGRSSDDPAELAARATEPLDAGHGIQFMLGAVQTALEHDELGEPFERAVRAFEDLKLSVSAVFTEYRMIYAYVAFARLTQLRRATGAERAAALAAARRAVRALDRAATQGGPAAGPLALTLLRGYDVVARASLEQLRGRPDDALRALAKAEDTLVRLDAPLVHYEAERVRARALAALGETRLADRHARAAFELAAEHGWERRARWIRTEFGAAVAAGGRRADSWAPAGGAGAEDPHRRRLQALQQVSMAAAQVLDPAKVARVALDETLRILGAERAVLFVADEGAGSLRMGLGRNAAGADLTELDAYSSTLVERVAAERRPLVVAGSEEGAALGSQSAVVHGLRSIMVAPMELDGRLTGVVYLDSRVAKGIFTEADVDILAAVASHIAVSLATARAAQLEVAVRAAQQQRDTADLLRTAMSELGSTFAPAEVLDRLAAILARTLPADRVCVLYADGADRTAAGRGPVVATTAGPELLDVCTGPAHGGRGDVPAEIAAVLGDARGWLAVPFDVTGHGRGVLLAGTAAADGFAHAHLDLVSALASQAAAAYRNARLFATVQELATTDGLTGLFNRRHFTEVAADRVAAGHPTALMIDVDHFKAVNDTYGHTAGDDVIRRVAETLRRHVRHPDVVGRYGGEEFAVVLDAGHGDALATAERLRAAVADLTVTGHGEPIRTTVSIGVAAWTPGDSVESLLGRADTALYRAKQAGRNRVDAG